MLPRMSRPASGTLRSMDFAAEFGKPSEVGFREQAIRIWREAQQKIGVASDGFVVPVYQVFKKTI